MNIQRIKEEDIWEKIFYLIGINKKNQKPQLTHKPKLIESCN